MTITFVGHGYVGLVTACVFADLGNIVYVVGRTPQKVEKLAAGNPLIYEPGLAEILQKNIAARRIFFTTSYETAIPNSDIVFIAVGTPEAKNGEADLSSVFSVAREIGRNLKKKYTVVSCKSTVPAGTNRKIYDILNKVKPKKVAVDVASCPEFLREGSALADTFSPDRIIIGSDSERAVEKLLQLHAPLNGQRVLVGLESAELIKYASNSLLATKISFANLMAMLAEKVGADVEEVLEGVGLDRRIGRVFLYPGVGYGGSCFPKDVVALTKTGQKFGVNMALLQAVDKINDEAKDYFVEKVVAHTPGKKIALWGLAFKPNTDDVREAPSIYVIKKLLEKKYKITVYDPEAVENTRQIFDDQISYAQNPYDAARGADTLLIITEWNEFKQIDLQKIKTLMKKPIIIDGRNLYDPQLMKSLGFTYMATGRASLK